MKALKTAYWDIIDQAHDAFREALTDGRAVTRISMCEGLAMARIGGEWVIFQKVAAFVANGMRF